MTRKREWETVLDKRNVPLGSVDDIFRNGGWRSEIL